jgi:hypothetical protein
MTLPFRGFSRFNRAPWLTSRPGICVLDQKAPVPVVELSHRPGSERGQYGHRLRLDIMGIA